MLAVTCSSPCAAAAPRGPARPVRLSRLPISSRRPIQLSSGAALQTGWIHDLRSDPAALPQPRDPRATSRSAPPRSGPEGVCTLAGEAEPVLVGATSPLPEVSRSHRGPSGAARAPGRPLLCADRDHGPHHRRRPRMPRPPLLQRHIGNVAQGRSCRRTSAARRLRRRRREITTAVTGALRMAQLGDFVAGRRRTHRCWRAGTRLSGGPRQRGR